MGAADHYARRGRPSPTARTSSTGTTSSGEEFVAAPPKDDEYVSQIPDKIGGFEPGSGGIYHVGDEWSVSGWSVERVMNLQYALVAAGFLDPEDIRTDGLWDSASAKALEQVMEISNGNRTSGAGRGTWQEILGQILESPDGANRGKGPGPGPGPGRAPLQIRLSNPEDLKTAFRQAAQQATGGVFVDENQINSMVTAYQEKEAEFQRQAYAGASTLTDPPSAGEFAEGRLEEVDEAGVEANTFANMTRVLLQLTGGE